MRHAVLVLLTPWFSREQGREFTIKVDQVLCVFSSLKLVLHLVLSKGYECQIKEILTSLSSEMSAQPRRT